MYVGEWLAVVAAEGNCVEGPPGGPRVWILVTEIGACNSLQKVTPLGYSKV